MQATVASALCEHYQAREWSELGVGQLPQVLLEYIEFRDALEDGAKTQQSGHFTGVVPFAAVAALEHGGKCRL